MTPRNVRRRDLLALLAGGSLAGCSALPIAGSDGGDGDARTTRVPGDRARALAERFAPTLYFDARETWFPTDPRPYVSERDGERVVHGFDTVEGYLQRFEDADAPPDPTVFYHAVEYDDSPLAVVQFWLYSAFDQFTTNFHWHDWEVVHAFVDTSGDGAVGNRTGTDDAAADSGTQATGATAGNRTQASDAHPRLYVASSHSRTVPNNEFLDPDGRPQILAELGSHSSAVSLNDRVESFQRFPVGDTFADVTNTGLDAVEALASFPIAYGLPRDEGQELPYVIPELDGDPVYDHPDLPTFERSHLVPEALTVRSFDELASPPVDLPGRATGTVFGPDGDADVTYDLVATSELEAIASFTGPQLSFEFPIPGFVENQVASHITTAGTPWHQTRYDDPTVDISDPRHRSELADSYDVVEDDGTLTELAGVLRGVVPDEDAPDGAGVTTTATDVEAAALVESEPRTAASFDGKLVARGLADGEHRLVVNGPGYAPYSERVAVDGSTAAGVDGHLNLVENRDAVKLRVDAAAVDADLRSLAVADDFAGRLYGTLVAGRDAVYVHAGGAYTAEVRDSENRPGAFRVNPDAANRGPVTIDRPETGKASLARFLASLAGETADWLADIDAGIGLGLAGLVEALESVRDAAGVAAERADAVDAAGADERLRAVQTLLDHVADLLVNVRGALPSPVVRAIELRLEEAERRAEQALALEGT